MTMVGPSTMMMLMVVGLSQAAPQISTSQVVSTVTSQLQPLISEAVARALASSSVTTTDTATIGFGNSGFNAGVSSTAGSGLTAEEEEEYNRKLSANAQYEYGYKVADNEAQTYMSHDETRNGANVEGQYSYVDSTGALVTVTYTAGPEGYLEERNVQAGAVEMRNIPGAWTGPLAGVDDVVEVVAPVRAVPVRPAQPAVDQSALIQLIISQLQPSINSAVQSAISSTSSVSRTVARAPVRQSAQAPQGFLDGVNSVRVQTPESYIEY